MAVPCPLLPGSPNTAECASLFPCSQGEPGYVLGGVEVIPGRNGHPGPPVSIVPFSLWH